MKKKKYSENYSMLNRKNIIWKVNFLEFSFNFNVCVLVLYGINDQALQDIFPKIVKYMIIF